jgi:hypothetical protein
VLLSLASVGKFKGAQGQRLCSQHAKEQGYHTVRNPCELCPADAKLSSHFENAAGQLRKLCTAHAKEQGCYTVRNQCTFTLLGGERCDKGGFGTMPLFGEPQVDTPKSLK